MRESVQKMKEKFKKFKSQKGFTLIELMAVLVILALIVMIAVPAVGNMIDKAKKQSAESNVELIENAAELAFISGDYEGEYTAKALAEGGFLKVEPTTGGDTADVADDTYAFDAEYTLAKASESGVFKATKK